MAKSSECLSKLGQAAADKYLNEKVELTEAVRELQKTAELSDEETKRVCEHANRATYFKLFHSAPVDDKIINFPLADFEKLATGPVVKAAAYELPKSGQYRYRGMAAYEGVELVKAASINVKPEVARNVGAEWSMTKRAAAIIRSEPITIK